LSAGHAAGFNGSEHVTSCVQPHSQGTEPMSTTDISRP